MKIELAVDQCEGEVFAAWLRERGHNVTILTSTGSYVDGVLVADDEHIRAREILNSLWNEYYRGHIEFCGTEVGQSARLLPPCQYECRTDDEGCGMPNGQGYECTRIKDHEGPHVACGHDHHAYNVWDA